MRKFKWLPTLLLLFSTIISFMNVQKAEASVFNMPKTDVVSDGGVQIDPKYSFVPTVTNKTQIQPFGGSGWKQTVWNERTSSTHNNRKFRSINVSNQNSSKGKIGARYTNVGSYNGQSIDLIITVNDWSPRTTKNNKPQYISFEEKNIAFSTQGYLWVDVTWQFVRSGTKTPVNVSGYLTLSDIDLAQGIQLSAGTSKNIDRFLITNRKNRLSYQNIGGQYKIYDGISKVDSNGYVTGTDYPDNQYISEQAFTMLYSDQSSFRFKWVTPENFINLYGNYNNSALGQYFFYVMNKPTQTEVPSPSKKVNITDGLGVKDRIKYTISQTVPQESSKFYYKSFEITDDLHTAWTDVKVRVENQIGENVSNLFNISVNSSNKVKVVAKDSTIKSAKFYGETYNVIIEAYLDANEFRGDNSTTVSNVAQVHTGNANRNTNKVTTKVTEGYINVRHEDENGNLLEKETRDLYLKGEKYAYSPKEFTHKESGKKYAHVRTKPSGVSVKGEFDGKDKTITFVYESPKRVEIKDVNISPDKYTSWNESTRPVEWVVHGEYFNLKPRTDISHKESGKNYQFVEEKSKYSPGKLKVEKNMTIELPYERPRRLEVRHIDEWFEGDDDELIKATNNPLIEWKHRYKYSKEKYSYTAREDLQFEQDGRKHDYWHVGTAIKPNLNNTSTAATKVEGNVEEDIVLTFKYDRPRVEVGLEHILIDTNAASEGLTAEVTYKLELIGQLPTKDKNRLNIAEYELQLYKMNSGTTGTLLGRYNQGPSTKDFQDSLVIERVINMPIKKYLSVGQEQEYGVFLKPTSRITSTPAPAFHPEKDSITTMGYTSTEEEIIIGLNESVEREEVVRTERYAGKDMQKYMEKLSVSPIEDHAFHGKTGYGLHWDMKADYVNEVGFDVGNIQGLNEKNEGFVGASLFKYDEALHGYSDFDYDGSINLDVSTSISKNSFAQSFKLPETVVSSDFKVYLKGQEPKGEKVYSAGRQLFVPVWIESLGTYNVGWNNSGAENGWGVHRIHVNLKDTIDVNAYMFGHINSDSIDEDEIIISPVDPSHPKVPSYFTEEEMEWIRQIESN